ncbi:chaplin [Actinacidiphila glaucinigra]|uniref:chaplin n=1 Tax=Actinacidiphila glaucinigra TaxID=235986 RepID=UPI002E361A43|nr:chaplin [Actinacidiphila glaucinigra]
MSIARKIPLAIAVVGGMVMAGAGVAQADNNALAVSKNGSGILSGIAAADIVSQPLNNCANHTPAGASLLSGTAGNACLIK